MNIFLKTSLKHRLHVYEQVSDLEFPVTCVGNAAAEVIILANFQFWYDQRLVFNLIMVEEKALSASS